MKHRDNSWLDRVQAWLATHHITRTLIIVGLVASVGYWRLQTLSDAQHRSDEREIVDNRSRLTDQDTIIANQNAIIAAAQADQMCIEAWANTTARELRTVTPLVSRLSTLEVSYENAVRHGNRTLANKRFSQLLAADKALRIYQSSAKVPLPALRCRVTLPKPTPAKPTPTRSGSKTITRTKTATVTVRVPGPTRTATVTVTAPPGKGHRR